MLCSERDPFGLNIPNSLPSDVFKGLFTKKVLAQSWRSSALNILHTHTVRATAQPQHSHKPTTYRYEKPRSAWIYHWLKSRIASLYSYDVLKILFTDSSIKAREHRLAHTCAPNVLRNNCSICLKFCDYLSFWMWTQLGVKLKIKIIVCFH